MTLFFPNLNQLILSKVLKLNIIELKAQHALIKTTAVCGPQCQQLHASVKPQSAGLFSQVTDFFSKLFDTSDWPPRWHCGTWSDFHGWLYIISDLMIWAAYFIIPVLLVRIITRRKDLPFPKIIWLFGAFIILCGTTHLIDAIIFWWPAYRLSALVRFITSIVSLFTVFILYKILPSVFLLRTVKELEHEIHERKLVEKKLAANEIVLNKSLELLAQHNKQLKNFTHILSHNIRNHASNISLLTSFVNDDTLDEDNADIIGKIKKVSEGLNQTLDDLSAVIKIRESVIETNELNFLEVTKKVMNILSSDISSNQAQIDIDFKVPSVKFPGIYLESIIMNLLSNSIKYRKKEINPHIQLKTYRNNEGHTVLECTDNGIGINLALHSEKIFGLYKTFHQHKNAHGVGLFLIKNQIESQGGQIAVESEPHKGTTFKIIFNE